MSKRDKKPKPKVITHRTQPKAVVAAPVATAAPVTREDVVAARENLVRVQQNPVHALIKVTGPRAERVYTFMVCGQCPVRKECHAASVKLADLESAYFTRTP